MHDPQLDSLPDSPIDYQSIPLGVGQEPNGYGGAHSFQFTKDVGALDPASVRRNPDETWKFISRVPERP